MSNQRILEQMAVELRRQGLTAGEVARLIGELDDHVADLIAEQGGSMNASLVTDERIAERLGRPEEIVAAAVTNRRQSSIFGRHPILSFVVAPIPLALLTWIGFLSICFGLLEVTDWALGDKYGFDNKAVSDWPAVAVYSFQAIEFALRFVCPAAAAALLGLCARRAGMSWKWVVTSGGLVALAAGALVVQMQLPVEPGEGKFMVGVGLLYQWINLIQLLVPIAVTCVFLLVRRRKAGRIAAL